MMGAVADVQPFLFKHIFRIDLFGVVVVKIDDCTPNYGGEQADKGWDRRIIQDPKSTEWQLMPAILTLRHANLLGVIVKGY